MSQWVSVRVVSVQWISVQGVFVLGVSVLGVHVSGLCPRMGYTTSLTVTLHVLVVLSGKIGLILSIRTSTLSPWSNQGGLPGRNTWSCISKAIL